MKEEEEDAPVALEEWEVEGPAEAGRGVRAKEEARLDMVSPPFDCCCCCC